MANAKKLKSGSYRIQAYDYTDAEGKRHYRSFTAATKREVQLMVAEWKASHRKRKPEEITVYAAVERYIAAKRNVLSPSTVRSYESYKRNYFMGDFGALKLPALSNRAVQVWISDIAENLSPKTVRNAYGLLAAALEMFAPEFTLKITLPAKIKPELYCPSDDDVKKLLEHIKGTDLEIAVMLAAFGPFRRGEICALTDEDIVGNRVIVRKSMVRTPEGEWVIKPCPKTYGSYREIEMPDFVINRIRNIKGPIVKITPTRITNKFIRVMSSLDIPRFRFHDLRHYSASIMHSIGVPDQYILQRGGWISDNVMKSVYRNVIDMEAKKQTQKINEHFSDMKIV